jgi:hypothetical protein
MHGTIIRVVLFALTVLGNARSAQSSCRGTAMVSEAERRAFIDAAYGEPKEVGVEILAADGCTQEILEVLERKGASMRFTDDKVGYLSLVLGKEKVLDVLDISGIEYAIVSFSHPEGERSLQPSLEFEPVPSFSIAFPSVAKELPKDGPYFPIAEAGLDVLWKAHAEADGRGVRVAVVDEGIDMLHPSLQQALGGTGVVLPKIADVSPPNFAPDDENWVSFKESVEAKNGLFTASRRTWIAPGDGIYRFGIYSRILSLPQQTSPSLQLHLKVGVLWNERTNRVWVDSTGDGNFGDQPALGDYAETHEIGFFGQKQDEADNRIPFALKIDQARQAVYFSIADGGHGTFVASPLAANRLTGGLFDGAAPSAQLVDVPDTKLPVLASLLRAFARDDVAVVNRSGRIGGQDGVAANREDFERHVLERAVDVYNKPIACYCGAKNTLSVRDYQSPEMLRRNRQSPPPYLDSMNTGNAVWFTPDGLVNTIFAPSTSLVAESRYFPHDFPGVNGRRGLSKLILEPPAPAGYGVGSNPSPTIPVVSGVLADLISEARREHVRFNVTRLVQAIFSGATWIEGFNASEQGFGVVNAAGAWEQLVRMAKGDDPKNPTLTSFKISIRRQNALTEVNGFHADADRSARSLDSEIWLSRVGGREGGWTYEFGLRGNDGTFTLIDKAKVLTQGKPGRVRFRAKVTPGLHIAFLQLRDANTGVVMQEVPLSVRVPETPRRVAPGVEEYTSTLPPRRLKEIYLHVGKETQAVRYSMRIPFTGPPLVDVRVLPGFHWGVSGNGFVATPMPAGKPIDLDHHVGPLQELESLVENTKAGTQSILWENRGRPEYETPYDPPAPDVAVTGTLTVSSYGLSLARSGSKNLRVTNKFAEIEGKVELYSAKLSSAQVLEKDMNGSLAVHRILPPHVAQWRIAVISDNLIAGAADVFALDCTSRENGCHVVQEKECGPSGALLTVDDPGPGDWQVLVRTRDARRSDVRVTIRDAMLNRMDSASAQPDERHRSGETWTVPLQQGAKYAGFRIRPCCDDLAAKSGLRIAVTPVDSVAP